MIKDFIRIILTLSTVVGVYAHHQLGLPHYLYSENYPQIPTMVMDADAEGYTVTFSIFPGNPMPGETVRIKIYIKHNLTDSVYNRPVQLSISSERFFGSDLIIVEPKSVNSDYKEYKLSHDFEMAEKYLVNLTFEPRPGYLEAIPFPIVIGNTNFKIMPFLFVGFLLLIFILVGVIHKKKGKSPHE